VTNLASNLANTMSAHADRVAVRVGDASMTYRELDEASARVAGLLRERGLKPGDRVGIMLPNVAEFPVVYYGVLRVGGVAVPMNPLLKQREVAYYLGDSGAGLIFAWHAFADEARGGAGQVNAEPIVVDLSGFRDLLASVAPDYEVADRDAGDTAVILYTSGTTGQPKGAELTHGNLTSKQVIHNTESAIRQYDLRGKAIALGWDASQITVIDIDQGHSGASAAGREGFQQMVAEVSLGRAGIILGLECSRLARNKVHHEVAGYLRRPRAVRVRGDVGQVDTARAVLDDDQGINAPEQRGVHVDKAGREMPRACAVRNCCQVGPGRRGAGSIPASCRICHTVEAAIGWPSLTNSPCTRRCPHDGKC